MQPLGLHNAIATASGRALQSTLHALPPRRSAANGSKKRAPWQRQYDQSSTEHPAFLYKPSMCQDPWAQLEKGKRPQAKAPPPQQPEQWARSLLHESLRRQVEHYFSDQVCACGIVGGWAWEVRGTREPACMQPPGMSECNAHACCRATHHCAHAHCPFMHHHAQCAHSFFGTGTFAQLTSHTYLQNLPTDTYLRSLMGQAEGGWVQLATIATFNRIASLGGTPETLNEALRASPALEVSQDGKAVRPRGWPQSGTQRVKGVMGGVGGLGR